MSVRRMILVCVGAIVGILEALILGQTEFSIALHFFSGLIIFVVLQILLWALSSIFVKDKGGAKLASIVYFLAYVLTSCVRGIFMALSFWAIVAEVALVFIISKILPKIIFSVMYSKVKIF